MEQYRSSEANDRSSYSGILANSLALAGTNASLASYQASMTAAFGNANSRIDDLSLVVTDDRQTAAEATETLTSSFNGLSATVLVQAATLATIKGKLVSYIKLEAIAGTATSRLTVMAENGQPSSILLSADQIILDGQVLLPGSVNALSINYGDFVALGEDSDGATYARTSPGTTNCAGLGISLPETRPQGDVEILLTADITYTHSGDGLQTPVFYDGGLILRVVGPDNVNYDTLVEPVTTSPLGTATPHKLSVRVPVRWAQSGTILVGAFVLRGVINQPGTPSTPGPVGEPPNPAIYGSASVNVSVTNLYCYAKWRFF